MIIFDNFFLVLMKKLEPVDLQDYLEILRKVLLTV